ncbi:MAG: ATP-binding cassette domain-containing protein [Candidatus Nanopelagicales bacterium]
MSKPSPLLILDHVSKEFVSAAGAGPVPVLKDVSLSMLPGESAAIVGPSGSGKSTLLNLIGTLDRPTRGRVRLAARPRAALSMDQGDPSRPVGR